MMRDVTQRYCDCQGRNLSAYLIAFLTDDRLGQCLGSPLDFARI